MKTLLEYKNRCRICLRSDAGPTNVYHYSIAGHQKPLAQIIFTLFKIKWQKLSAFPSLLCRRCSIEMEQVLLFKKEIEQNQLHLAKLFQNTKSSFSGATKLEPDQSLKTEIKTSQVWADINGLDSKVTKVEQPTPKRKRRTCLTDNGRKRQSKLVSKNVSSISNIKSEIKSENVSPKEELPQKTDLVEGEVEAGPMPLSTTPLPELDIPQEVFLQNLNLLTLQEAEVLRKKESKQTGIDLIAKKKYDVKSSHMSKSNDKIMPKCVSKKTSIRKKRHIRRSTLSSRLLQNRSLNFLFRYGCRKIDNSIQLKHGKTILRPQDVNSGFRQIRLIVSSKRTPKTLTESENARSQKCRKK